MAPDGWERRYRRWYGRLVRLYPRRFRERFGEPMVQTFTDLCREHRESSSTLHRLAFRTFADTLAGVIRENSPDMMPSKNMVRWVLATGVILLVPLVAMLLQFKVQDPGRDAEEAAWGVLDFVVAGALLLGTGLTYELAARSARHLAHRVAVGLAVAGALLLVWINLAVGMIGAEDNPANLMYLAVLGVGVIGASVARLRPRGMARALLATAVAQALVAATALVAGLAPTVSLDAVFVALWVASGLLLRHAGMAASPSR